MVPIPVPIVPGISKLNGRLPGASFCVAGERLEYGNDPALMPLPLVHFRFGLVDRMQSGRDRSSQYERTDSLHDRFPVFSNRGDELCTCVF